jgi:electron transport complex protein RnfE
VATNNPSSELFLKGMFKQNPVFVIMLGMCSTLAITTSLENALGMGLATLFVLVASNTLIASIRHITPEKVRMPVFIVVIATFVTVAALLMEAYVPSLFVRLGIYVPLIVVNCIIMGRAEAFAYKNRVGKSAIDGLAMGLGFCGALCLIGGIREILGTSKLVFLGHTLVKTHLAGIGMMVLPPGAYLVLGLLLVTFKVIGDQWKTS